MKSVIRVNVIDDLLADQIEEALKDLPYKFQRTSDTSVQDSSTVITDCLSLLDSPEFQDNLTTPVLYMHSLDSFDPELIVRKNIFRAARIMHDTASVLETPAKAHPVQAKKLSEIVEFLIEARNTIDNFELLLDSPEFEESIANEQHCTENGEYGAPDSPQPDLNRIRGEPRQISRVEAAYQAIEAYKLFKSTKEINGAGHKKILLISPDQKKIMKYAKFLQTMTGSLVEVGTQFYNFTADEIQQENYSLIIYDGAETLSTETGIRDLENLIERAWAKKIEVLTMCNPKKALRIMRDPQMRYKTHSFIFSENPGHEEFLESVMHTLEIQSGRSLANMLDRPSHALVADAIQNLLRSEDPGAIARGKDQLKHALAYYTRRPVEAIEDLDVLATDDLFSAANWDLPADESQAGHLKLPEVGYLIKFFPDERRAKCETIAMTSLQSFNAKKDVKLEKAKTGNLSKKEDLYWKNMPKINTRRTAKSHGKILISDYIFGPTLEQLAPAINKKISSEDKQAVDFRNRVLFAMNAYCALFQVKKDLFPLAGIDTEETQFSRDFAHILSRIKALGISDLSAAEYRCADACAEIFDLNISDPHSTQYSDFYWDNIIIETGNDADTFDDLMEKRKAKGLSMEEFIEEHVCRIDFNKTYRLTSKTEDPSRFAVKNFMRPQPRNKTERDTIEDDRGYFYTHFLLHRRKFQLLEELMQQGTIYDEFEPQIEEISKLIDRLENKPWLIKDKDNEKINEIISAEKKDFFYTERYVTAYRTARHTLLLFNSMKNQKSRQATGRISENQASENAQFIEKELKATYAQVINSLRTIIDDKKDCLKRKGLDVSVYQDLISEANRQLTADHAAEFKDYLSDIKSIENPEERNALFTYMSANYLHAFFKKVRRSKFDIDYEAL